MGKTVPDVPTVGAGWEMVWDMGRYEKTCPLGHIFVWDHLGKYHDSKEMVESHRLEVKNPLKIPDLTF